MSKSNTASKPPDAEGILECTDCLDPAEAFALVGNEVRLSILEALWAADESAVSFSEL